MEKRRPHPINDRMRRMIKFYDGSLTAFGLKAGMSRESVSQYLRSDTTSKNMLNSFRLVYPECDMNYIMTGEGSPTGPIIEEKGNDELIETLIKANKYQAEVIEKLWKEREQKDPFLVGDEPSNSRFTPSERLKDFARHSQVSFLHRPYLS